MACKFYSPVQIISGYKILPGAFVAVFASILLLVASLNPALSENNTPEPDAGAEFPVESLEITTGNGQFVFSVEIADEDEERSKGLMFRETMLPTHGMLFDFGKTATVAMWMQNTPLPLDMVFIRSDGSVARVARNTVPFSRDIVSSGEPVSHVLELNAGIALQIGLKPDDRINHRYFTAGQ